MAYSDDYYGETDTFFYYYADYSFGFAENFSLDFHVGYNDLEKNGGFLAMSRTCTHLGCTVPWVEDEGRFVCPCHSSVFDINGDVVDPPAFQALLAARADAPTPPGYDPAVTPLQQQACPDMYRVTALTEFNLNCFRHVV